MKNDLLTKKEICKFSFFAKQNIDHNQLIKKMDKVMKNEPNEEKICGKC